MEEEEEMEGGSKAIKYRQEEGLTQAWESWEVLTKSQPQRACVLHGASNWGWLFQDHTPKSHLPQIVNDKYQSKHQHSLPNELLIWVHEYPQLGLLIYICHHLSTGQRLVLYILGMN